MDQPTAYSPDEARAMLLQHFHSLVDYWDAIPKATTKEKMDGLVFSILTTLDGCSSALPAIDLHMHPHESDKQFCISQGERWFEPGQIINDGHVLMHDEWYAKPAPK